MSARDMVFVDVETTGLLPDRHHVLELAAVRVTEEGTVVAWMSERVWPVDMRSASDEALRINGFDILTWQREGVWLADALRCAAVYRGLVGESPLIPELPPELRRRA